MKIYRRVRVPTSGPPLVRKLFALMHEEQIGLKDMAERSGISYQTLTNWQRGDRDPTTTSLEACYNVLGYTLIPVPIGGRRHQQSNLTPS